MRKVKFVRDFRSASTRERFFYAGMIGQVDDAAAAQLVAEGVAIIADAGARVDAPVPDGPSDAELRHARDARFWSGRLRHMR